jgi:diguanylate cyclase (GGDEF)-like protein
MAENLYDSEQNQVSSFADEIQTAGDLCRETVFVEDTTLNKAIYDIFEQAPQAQNIPILSNGDVVGLINRDNFTRSMARRFHWELYANKRCTKMMDLAPVTVEADTPISQIADRLLGSQNSNRLSDGFVVKRGKKLVGTGLTSDVLAALLFSQKTLSERLVSSNLKLLELSITDPLTGVYNRRHFNEILPIELKRAQRDGLHLGLLMADIDFFKKLNDKLGHQAGDEALILVTSVFKQCLNRPSDYCFRVGGEEFCIVTTGESTEQLIYLCEKIRSEVASLKIGHPSHPEGILTISVGLAYSSSENHFSPHQIYELADLALYEAKSNGRNRVCISNSMD